MLTRWNPYRELENMRDMMERAFADFGASVNDNVTSRAVTPATDIIDHDDHVELRVDLPGFNPDDVTIEFQNGYLSISAETKQESEVKEENYTRRERYQGSYRRSLRVPETLSVDDANARFENGVLFLSLPKVPAEQPKRIPVHAPKVIESGSKN